MINGNITQQFMTRNQCGQSSYTKISRRTIKFKEISRISRSCRHPEGAPVTQRFSNICDAQLGMASPVKFVLFYFLLTLQNISMISEKCPLENFYVL